MPLLRQLEFAFRTSVAGIADPAGPVGSINTSIAHPGSGRFGQNFEIECVEQASRLPNRQMATEAVALQLTARNLLRAHGAGGIAMQLRVEWNSRLKTAAGRADYRDKVILLNPLLSEYPSEIDRTLRHELAHFLAQFRAGRRRIPPHGAAWQQACVDLGIADEKRCHNLPFPGRRYNARFIYICPNCRHEFRRVRRVRRVLACLACCRKYNRGKFDSRFRLLLRSSC